MTTEPHTNGRLHTLLSGSLQAEFWKAVFWLVLFLWFVSGINIRLTTMEGRVKTLEGKAKAKAAAQP